MSDDGTTPLLRAALDAAVSYIFALEGQKDEVVVRARRSYEAALVALDEVESPSIDGGGPDDPSDPVGSGDGDGSGLVGSAPGDADPVTGDVFNDVFSDPRPLSDYVTEEEVEAYRPRSPIDDGPAVFARARSLLGRQVKVSLSRDGTDPAAVAQGRLLRICEGGELAIEDDVGMISYCWPMLDIEADHSPEGT